MSSVNKIRMQIVDENGRVVWDMPNAEFFLCQMAVSTGVSFLPKGNHPVQFRVEAMGQLFQESIFKDLDDEGFDHTRQIFRAGDRVLLLDQRNEPAIIVNAIATPGGWVYTWKTRAPVYGGQISTIDGFFCGQSMGDEMESA